jgi:hypothetical protein
MVDLEVYTETIQTDSDGQGQARIEVDRKTRSFLLDATADEPVQVLRVLDPDGEVILNSEDWTDSDTKLTLAVWSMADQLSLNWPVRVADGELDHGEWTVELEMIAFSGLPIEDEIELTVYRNNDTDLSDGTVKVRIVFAEGVDQEEGVREAYEEATVELEDIWSKVGLNLEVSFETSDLDPDLPYPKGGDDVIATTSAEGSGDEILMLVGESIEGESSDLYGAAGGIPGALTATRRSAISLSWLTSAGVDGVFNGDDVRLLGETMAHELGHYMGLFHPVEVTFDSWDALDDTPECSTQQTCENKLSENLMYPYTDCGIVSCEAMGDITDEQAGVLQRYTGTL